jgi:hypothetical protein
MHSRSLDHWTHEHVFLAVGHARNERRSWLVVGLTGTMMVEEIIGGIVFGSMAFLADGWHMGTHVAALVTPGDDPYPLDMKVTAGRTTHHAHMTSTPTFSLENLVRDGILPKEYAASSDPERLLNIVIKPEMVEILVAGDPGRNQSRAYMSNHVQGPPTSRRIELPRDWEQRLKQSRG